MCTLGKEVHWNWFLSNFSIVIFGAECKTKLDRSDGWAESWSIHGYSHQHDLEDNNRGCGVMF